MHAYPAQNPLRRRALLAAAAASAALPGCTFIQSRFVEPTAAPPATLSPPPPPPSVPESPFGRSTYSFDSGAQMWVLQRSGATFHHYVAPDAGGAATSVIVELRDQLLLIDTQIAPSYARELRYYVNTLPKRISRVFFSHEHPDTWSGWSEFAEFPAFAPRETEAFLHDRAPRMPARPQVRIPQLAGTIGAGDEIVGGVRMQVRLVRDAEAAATATFSFPEQSTIVASDLIYQKWHPYLGNRQLERWNSILEQLPTWVKGDALILPGHGKPTDRRAFGEMQRYLAAAQEAFARLKSVEEISSALREKFPDYGGSALLRLGITHALQRR